ncbi:hypothetical protein AWM75_00085 [Aerococcus urinaehominis]|uniref:Uncharacterized protein n=1 Tax=Aerococcus urinaehominis TaxID=128944 RepID=A0A120IAM1_9LACT|nr:hypothetical protein AWM75_00085 [Aerococcus urinaehominis]SDL81243.1 transcriptional regulator, DeoR family [Aerococcus urinaehominis]
MLQADRRQAILEILAKEGSIKTSQISTRLQTTRQTIHADLEFLHNEGKLTMVRGGAVQKKTSAEDSAMVRRQYFQAEKAAIGKLAASQVDHGDTIFIDMGTTALAMVDHLADKEGLSVVTNSIEID